MFRKVCFRFINIRASRVNIRWRQPLQPVVSHSLDFSLVENVTPQDTNTYIYMHALCMLYNHHLNGWQLHKIRFLFTHTHTQSILWEIYIPPLSSFRRKIHRKPSDLIGSDALYDHRYKYVPTRHKKSRSFYYSFLLSLLLLFPLSSIVTPTIISSRLPWFFNGTTSS